MYLESRLRQTVLVLTNGASGIGEYPQRLTLWRSETHIPSAIRPQWMTMAFGRRTSDWTRSVQSRSWWLWPQPVLSPSDSQRIQAPPQMGCLWSLHGGRFRNAFSITYGLDYWSSLRSGRWDNVNADIWGTSESPVWGAGLRNWLSEHSMVYRLDSTARSWRWQRRLSGSSRFLRTVILIQPRWLSMTRISARPSGP